MKSDQPNVYPRLYSYFIWCNHHENLWYAIPRDLVGAFFSGKEEKIEGVISDKSLESLMTKFQ